MSNRRAEGAIAGGIAVALVTLLSAAAPADPPTAGMPEREAAARPGAAALGPGTIFLTRSEIRLPETGIVFLSDGKLLPALAEPVGSCRLRGRTPGGRIASGTPLTVASVTSTTSPYEDRGISSVSWRFVADDPAESLLCDTVGNAGPSQGDVEAEVRDVLQIEAAQPPPE